MTKSISNVQAKARSNRRKHRLLFLGAGSAFTTDNWQSNMLFSTPAGENLLIDCGGDARHALKQNGKTAKDINAVYISHLHNDHIGGLEWLGFSTFFANLPKPKLYIHGSLAESLWRALSPGMSSLEGQQATLDTFFDVHLIGKNGGFQFGDVYFNLVQVVHIVSEYSVENSFGLLFDTEKATVFLTTDTQFSPNQIAAFYDKADVIFHDVETGKFPSGVHAHFDFLKTLPGDVREKMWLYHYNDGPLPNARAEGFHGFVKTGQSFYF